MDNGQHALLCLPEKLLTLESSSSVHLGFIDSCGSLERICCVCDSQNQQMNNLLIKNQMLVDGAIIPSTTVPAADQNRIVSIIEYFNRKHSLQDLKVLPDNFTLEQMEETFGLVCHTSSLMLTFCSLSPEKSIIYRSTGYDYYFATNFGLQNELQSSETLVLPLTDKCCACSR